MNNEDLETIIREVYSCYDARYGNAIVDLKQRIDKAIEYIKRYEKINGYYDSCYDGEYDTYSHDNVKEELLSILKGSDNK